jgi:hypothetical protein
MDWLPNVGEVSYFVREILPTIRRHRPEVTIAVVGRDPAPVVRGRADQDRRITVTGTVPDVRTYF